jgi:hypothetical protein
LAIIKADKKTLLRQAKRQQSQKLADKLKNGNILSADIWKILKHQISTSSKIKGIQILEDQKYFDLIIIKPTF